MLRYLICIVIIACVFLTGYKSNPDDFVLKDSLKGGFQISISLRGVAHGDDSLVLAFYDCPISDDPNDNVPTIRVSKSCKEEAAVFNISPDPIIGYYCLFYKAQKDKSPSGEVIVNFCPVMKGDSYSVAISRKPNYAGSGKTFVYTAKGVGAATLDAFQDLEWARDTGHAGGSIFTDELEYNASNYADDKMKIMLNALNRSKTVLPPKIYNLLLIDAVLSKKSFKYTDFRTKYRSAKTLSMKERLNRIYEKYLKNDSIDPDYFTSISTQIPDYLVEKEICDSYYDSGMVSYKDVYNSIVCEFSDNLREKVLIYFFRKYLPRIPDALVLVDDSRKYISEGLFNQYLRNIESNRTGAQAFNFKLLDKYRDTIHLSSFKGKVVFMDFWFTGCTPCKLFYKSQLKDVEELYRKNNDVVFFTVSVDKEYDTWRKSLDEGEYTSDKAINLYTGGLGSEHPIIGHYAITSYPRPLLIDKSGRIVNVGAINYLRNKKNIIHAIDSLLN